METNSGESEFTDNSVFRPYLTGYFVWTYRFVPWAIPANIITLVSGGVIWSVFYALSRPDLCSTQFVCLLTAFSIHFHMLGDQMDGMQAVRTQTCSPLGGFLDHYCDCYTASLMVLAGCAVGRTFPHGLMYVIQWLCLMAFVATYVEEHKTKKLHFGFMGPLEAEVIMIFYFVTIANPFTKPFWEWEPISGYANYWIIAFLAIKLFYTTVVNASKRMKGVPRQYIVFGFTSISLVFTLSSQTVVSDLQGWTILTLYGTDYLGNVMRSHIQSKPLKYPPIISSLAALFLCPVICFHLIDDQSVKMLLDIFLVYLIFWTLMNFFSMISLFRDRWVWVNPRIPVSVAKSRYPHDEGHVVSYEDM